MGKFKESQSEVFEGRVAMAPDGTSGFTQPSFVGLINIIRGLGFQYDFEESNVAEQDSGFSQAEEYNPNQLQLFGA